MDKIIPKATNPLNSEGVSQCFSKVNAKLYLSLAPCHITNPINGLKAQHLDSLIMTYFPQAEGVVISYSNIKILKDGYQYEDTNGVVTVLAKVGDSSPFTFVWVSVDFIVWKPQVNDFIEGYIYMQTASHIGLLIHDTFNASIKKFNIPQNWEFVPQQVDEVSEEDSKVRNMGYWVDENGAKIEGKIKFMIKYIHNSSRVVNIDGTLIQPGSEVENQPVSRKRRSSVSIEQVSQNKHKKFDDDDDINNEKPMEPIEEKDTETPHYSDSD